MSRFSVNRDGEIWDIVINRPTDKRITLVPVWLVRWDESRSKQRELLCQVGRTNRRGWSVVVAGEVTGLRLVEGFASRWNAIWYALNVREDIPGDNY